MFGIILDRYQEAFLRKASYILRSSDAAEDAVQETFLKVYKYADRFSERENASFRSWAYKILTNVCYDAAEKRSRDSARVKILDTTDLDIAGSIDDANMHGQVSQVQSVLARLPENLSRLITLYFFEEKSYEEIAINENISLSAVRSGLHRAKKKFKSIAIEMI